MMLPNVYGEREGWTLKNAKELGMEGHSSLHTGYAKSSEDTVMSME